MRPNISTTFMNIASEWSERSTCSARIKVGAVLVNQFKQIISSGFNGPARGMPHCDDEGCLLDNNGHCTMAIHAEENVIIQCALNGVSSRGCDLYITHSPCTRCCYRIIQAGIASVFYDRAYRDESAMKSILLTQGILVSKMEVR